MRTCSCPFERTRSDPGLGEESYDLKKADHRCDSDPQSCGSLSLIVVAGARQIAACVSRLLKADEHGSAWSLHLRQPFLRHQAR